MSIFFDFREAKLECRDRDKNTPLLISAKKNHVNAVKFLLKHGADPSAKDKNDRNVYHYTALEGCIDTLKVVKYTVSQAITLAQQPCNNTVNVIEQDW